MGERVRGERGPWTSRPPARPAATLLRAAVVYWLVIFPFARRQLRAWRRRADAIPDPALRRSALVKLAEEHLSSEGAAAFGLLAASRRLRDVVRLCVALEVMYDFLDALGERPVANMEANNRALHGALAAAFELDAPLGDYYRHHPGCDDGGYLCDLVRTCRDALARLPGHRCVAARLVRAARRAAEVQTLNHAGVQLGYGPLDRWSRRQGAAEAELRWWEVAAGAGSPLVIFALLAGASHRGLRDPEATAIETAYFPWIAALHWLLESVVDQADDERTGNHSYVARYGSAAAASARLAVIATRAVADARALRGGDRHVLLLSGMVALNLSHEGADDPAASTACAAVRSAFGGAIAPLLLMLRVRQRLRAERR